MEQRLAEVGQRFQQNLDKAEEINEKIEILCAKDWEEFVFDEVITLIRVNQAIVADNRLYESLLAEYEVLKNESETFKNEDETFKNESETSEDEEFTPRVNESFRIRKNKLKSRTKQELVNKKRIANRTKRSSYIRRTNPLYTKSS
mgnify:FL=1